MTVPVDVTVPVGVPVPVDVTVPVGMTRRFVIVGAGGTGIPLAARLAEAGHEVVLLEAGPAAAPRDDTGLADALENAWTVRAGLPDGPLAATYETELLQGRFWRIARGRVLGGSTAVNGAYFQRPHPDDFRTWEQFGGPEWSYAACVPALRRLERDLDADAADVRHGHTGPVPVQRWGHDDRLTQAFVAGAVDAGALAEADKNAGGSSGVGLLPRNAIGAQRWSVARAYGGLLERVEIRTGAAVRRIRIVAGAAIGVELADGAFVAADEVILCAGAIETPRLLMASGVGDPARVDGPVHAALPGVGRGLSDHAAVVLEWTPRPGVAPLHPPAAWSAAWNDPSTGFEVLLAVAPTAAIVSGDRDARGPFELRVNASRPASRGEVLPRGADTDVRYGYLADAADRGALREAVRAAAGLLRRGPLAEVVADAAIPPWVDAAGGDEEADAWVRAHVGTALHSCGTARMGADPMGVVDARGRVHGVSGLRVADASILPVVPSRGTALTAVMLGERLAESVVE